MVDKSIPAAKKSLGQHWLIDNSALHEIYDMAEITDQDVVLEIGPGTGNLTRLLTAKAKQVIAVELDRILVDMLEQLSISNLQVINQDILSLDFNQLPGGYKLVANIPYYLTGKLIRLISETSNRPSLVVLLVQKEIAERLSAGPDNLSILGLTCQYFYDVEKGSIVPASSFDPPPKVDSQIVKLIPRSKLPLAVDEQKTLFRLIKIGFASKRKTILNNLSSSYSMSKDELRTGLESINVEPTARPQTLSMDQWLAIDRLLNI